MAKVYVDISDLKEIIKKVLDSGEQYGSLEVEAHVPMESVTKVIKDMIKSDYGTEEERMYSIIDGLDEYDKLDLIDSLHRDLSYSSVKSCCSPSPHLIRSV